MTVDTQQQGEERVHWLPMVAAISSISVVGIAIGLGMPLLSVILETRGHSASMIGLNTAVAGLASIAGAPLATPLAMPLRVLLHIALTVLFILSEFWISTSAPPHRRGLVLGIYATVLSLGFAAGPWLFSHLGSTGFLPFGVTIALVT